MDLYESLPKGYDKMPVLDYYKAEKKYTDCVFLIFPFGGHGVGIAKKHSFGRVDKSFV